GWGHSAGGRRKAVPPKSWNRRGGAGMAHFNRSGGSGHGPQEGTFLAQDEALLLRKAEVGRAFAIGLEPRTVGFVGGEAIERNQPIGDGVGAFMRHPVAEEIPAALRNDGEPTARVVLEGVALKWIELVADEDRDGHGSLRDRQPYPAAFRGEHASDIVELCLLDERRRRARCRPRRRHDLG